MGDARGRDRGARDEGLVFAQQQRTGLALQGGELNPPDAGHLAFLLHRGQALVDVAEAAAEVLLVGPPVLVVGLDHGQFDEEDLDGDGLGPAVELLHGLQHLVEDGGRGVDQQAVAPIGAGLDFGGALEVFGEEAGQVPGGGVLDDVGAAFGFRGGPFLCGERQDGQRQPGAGEQAVRHGELLPGDGASEVVEGIPSDLSKMNAVWGLNRDSGG